MVQVGTQKGGVQQYHIMVVPRCYALQKQQYTDQQDTETIIHGATELRLKLLGNFPPFLPLTALSNMSDTAAPLFPHPEMLLSFPSLNVLANPHGIDIEGTGKRSQPTRDRQLLTNPRPTDCVNMAALAAEAGERDLWINQTERKRLCTLYAVLAADMIAIEDLMAVLSEYI
eukprot:gene14373-4231_t